MRRHVGRYFFALLVPAFCLIGASAVVEAAQPKSTRWSDRATWPNRKLPSAGDQVTIAAGKEVILDVSPPALGGLTINGKLTTAASGTEHRSLDALRKASDTSYYKGKDSLWVKVVSNGSGARGASPGSGTSLQVSR
jgi:hypothetical protein